MYVGADALTIEEAVATPIEQTMTGVDSMIYMRSYNVNDGTMNLRVDFEVGTDPNVDNVLTYIRLAQAIPQLPSPVQKFGISVLKAHTSPLAIFAIYSPKGTYDATFLANYAYVNINDPMTRVNGIGQVLIQGAGQYAMRFWVKPDQLASLSITITDLVTALDKQNVINAAGQVGAQPVPPGQAFTYTMRTQGRLVTEQEFGAIVIRANPDGSYVRMRDVARVELGAQTYNNIGRLNGSPAAIVNVYQLPGYNALEAVQGARRLMEELKQRFPVDMDYVVSLDTTLAVTEGIREIYTTLGQAMLLVILVVFVFLQSVRATLIPAVAVPVSLIGTFIFFPLLGFSVNTLSMFGLVLAIGIVVDDAIVVVEAVMHHIEHGMSPRDATVQAMKEVSAPVIGIALILSAVFIPVAFIPGLTGRMYQQFALTIAISVLLSAFSALSLSPALAAMLLKPAKPMRGPLGKFFSGFNKVFEKTTSGYVAGAKILVRKSILTIGIVALVAVGAGLFGSAIPAGFIPEEDQGIMGVNVTLPAGSSLERTSDVLAQVEEILSKTEGIESYQTVGGYGVVTSTYQPNFGTIFVRLKPWAERHGASEHVLGFMGRLSPQFARIPEAIIFPFNIPTISGFGASAGFNFLLQDRSGTLSIERLGELSQQFQEAVRKRPEIGNLFTSFDPRYPQVKVELDREKARKLGVPVDQVFQVLSASLGGAYVNDFNRFGRLFRVYVQAEADYRRTPKDIGNLWVRSTTTGDMVPLGTLVTISSQAGTELTNRFNLLRSVELQGVPARGFASGQALAALEAAFKETMPPEMGFAYSSLSYQEKTAAPAGPTFVAAILFVFLLLAAMYESWRLPWAVLLGSPLVALGAFFGVWLLGYDNNVYVQIGNIMLIGLAAKNAILIVEFAKAKHEEGMPIEEAALESARLRFRPILMTAFAFILGVVPLMRASGAGAGAQNVMGTAVFFGMLVATALGVFLIPGNFAFVEQIGRKKKLAAAAAAHPPQPAPTPGGAH
jgi:HAE1 family hydrophobic/amphiphilic exporter-1